MQFALVQNGAIVATDSLTGVWKAPDGTQYVNMAIWPEADRNALGWFAVSDMPPSFDPASQQLAQGAVALINGVPTQQYTVSALPLAAQAASMLAAGLAITSTGTPALSATYPTDPATQQKMLSVQVVLTATGAFPGDAQTWQIKDAGGSWHTVTPAQYLAIGSALAAFVAQLDLVIEGQLTTLPAASATIA